MPGRVTHELAEMLRRLLCHHPLVVWYDGEGAYETIVDSLELEGIRLFKLLPSGPPPKLGASFFGLRRQLDPFIEDLEHGKALAYIRLSREQTEHAMIEADLVGVAIYPKAASTARNTNLAVVARRALKGHVLDAVLGDLCRKAGNGAMTAEQIDLQEMQGRHRARHHLSAVLGSTEPHDIALRFLSDPAVGDLLGDEDAHSEMRSLLREVYGLDATGVPLSDLRETFERHLLLSDLVSSLSEPYSAPAGASVAIGSDSLRACAELAGRWRDSEARRTSYLDGADRFERVWPLPTLGIGPRLLLLSDTIRGVDIALLQEAERRIAGGESRDIRAWAKARRSRFWWRNDPELAVRWAAIEAAAALFEAAALIESELPDKQRSLLDLVAAYSGGDRDADHAWCRLDRSHRNLMRLADSFEERGFEAALTAARRRYEEVVELLAEAMHETLQRGPAALGAELSQPAIYSREVAPLLDRGRVAYILVDALRYEMALDLLEGLPGGTTLRAALAVVPSITRLGMAALLPGAEQGVEVSEKSGQLVAVIAGEPMKERAQRLAYARKVVGEQFAAAKLQDLHAGRKVSSKVKNAKLLMITSQEIDQFGESDNEPVARRTMDDIVGDIHRVFHLLVDWGFDHAVLSADHGYLFGDRVGRDRSITPPGNALDLHRRVWVGRGGTTPPGCLRLPLQSFCVGGDFDVVLPPGLSVFKAGGSLAYFHGGATLQERVIPVLNVKLSSSVTTAAHGEFVTIDIDRHRGIVSRAWSAELTFGSLLRQEARVRVVATYAGRVVGDVMAAGRGFTPGTGEVPLEAGTPNVVTLVLREDVVHLDIEVRDAQSDQLLGSATDVPVRLGV